MIQRLVLFSAAAALFATAAFSQINKAVSYTDTSTLPPVGVASSETLQVNVVNHAGANNNGTAAQCTGSISFTNASGTAVGSATSF